MPKSKKKFLAKHAIIPRLIKDHNLVERYQRNEIEIEVGADPEHPKRSVTRMRKKNAYDELCKRGTITEEQRLAAEHYAILCEKTLGATGDLYARINLLNENRNKWEPTPSQHEAYKKLFLIWKGMGKYQIRILNLIILNNFSCNALAKYEQCSRQHAVGLTTAIFNRLEELFP